MIFIQALNRLLNRWELSRRLEASDEANVTIEATSSVQITLAPDLEEIRAVGTRVHAISETLLSVKDSSQMELCVVEALTNITKHGSNDDQGRPVAIKVDIEVEDDQLLVRIEDNGPGIPVQNLDATLNFDPLDLDSLPEGGMGLFIIRQFVDSFSYESANGAHVMTLTKGRDS